MPTASRVTCLTHACVLQAKITDFGLSKVMSEEEHEGGGMELTSQVQQPHSICLACCCCRRFIRAFCARDAL